MVSLRRIGLYSAGRLGFWLGLALALTNFVIFMVFLLVVAQVPLSAFGLGFFIRVVIGLVLSAVNSAITFGTMAFLYNTVANGFGGLQLEFEPLDTPDNKPKNDQNPPAGKNQVPIDTDDDDSDIV